jgi:hypothetical protein
MAVKSSSPIPWLNDLIVFIEGKEGLEAWIKKYISDLLVVMEGLIAKAGKDWLAKVEELVIEASTMDLDGNGKFAWVLEQIAAQSIISLTALGKAEMSLLIEYIVNKCKQERTIA